MNKVVPIGNIEQVTTTAVNSPPITFVPCSKPLRVPLTIHRCVEPPDDGVWADA